MSNRECDMPRLVRVEETDSTNSLIRQMMAEGAMPEGSVVVANFQTAGRGQVGNVWESEAGKNLMFSMVIYPSCIPANSQFLISQIAALSVKETLDEYTGGVSVKWPNDIYWQDKKICGMLIENDLSGRNLSDSIIGVGLNVNQEEFHSDAPNPVSLFQIIGREVDRDDLLDSFRRRFYNYYLSLLNEEYDDVRERYRASLYRSDGFYTYSDSDGCFEARIHDIESTGHLHLELKDGSRRRYAFKEVSYII